MAILNITYQGQSADYDLAVDFATTDADIRRIAVEIVRSGELRGLHVAGLSEHAFTHYVVDRLRTAAGGLHIYLRPKVPFGASESTLAGNRPACSS